MLWSYGKIVNILLLYRLMTFEVQSCFNLYGVNRKEKGWSQKANKNVSLKKNFKAIYFAIDCVFKSCHIHVLQWIYNLR